MKIKICLGDWFYNLGLIGFIKIMQKAGKEQELKISHNYLEFDSEVLVHFQDYYFSYFNTEYNTGNRLKQTFEYYRAYITAHPEYIKETIKSMREIIKKNAEKVKKFDEEACEQLTLVMEKLSKIKSMEDYSKVEDLIKETLEIINRPIINERLTSNYYKFILSNNFFGQVSFLNVSKSALDTSELKKIMYKDYISSIVHYGRINDLLQDNEKEKLVNYIDEQLPSKDMYKGSIAKIMTAIKKQLGKGADLEEIKTYLESGQLQSCVMCHGFKGIVEEYSEGHFIPLAVSSDNARNMYWNFNFDRSICAICKLILFCAPAGTTYIRKNYLQNEENEFYSFINLDGSIEEIRAANNRLTISRDKEHPFKAVVADMVTENKKKSEWQLNNILFIEFNATYNENCILNYFNMPVYLARFFKEQDKSVGGIYNSKLRGAAIDMLFKEKDLKYLIIDTLLERLKEQEKNKKGVGLNQDCFKLVRVRYYINAYKGGCTKVDDKKLKVIRYSGEKIRAVYLKDRAENKLSGIAYRLLNTAKAGNKKDFMDTLLRIFIASGESVPTLFMDVMAEKELDFESIAYAFISGLISEKYEGNVEKNNQEVRSNE